MMISRALSLCVDLILLSGFLWLLELFLEEAVFLILPFVWLYFAVSYCVFRQTGGYWLLGYRIKGEPNKGSVTLRLILRAGLKTLCLGLIVPLLPIFGNGDDKRSLVDLICGTSVVST
jgi:uncharacterized RDD family membrane protein YckC